MMNLLRNNIHIDIEIIQREPEIPLFHLIGLHHETHQFQVRCKSAHSSVKSRKS